MRILIITGIFPPDIGGPATYVPQIASILSQNGHDITVVTLSDRVDHDDARYLFRVRRLSRRTFKPWRWFSTVVLIVRLGRNTDILFVNGLAMEAVIANSVLRKPIVQKVAGDLAWERAINWGWTKDSFEEFQKDRNGLKVEFLKMLRNWWTCGVDKVIVPSSYLAGWVARWGVGKDKIAVIHNEVEPLNGIERAEVPLQTPIKIVTVGRLVPWKNVDKVMQIVSGFEGVGLVIIGDGPECGRLKAFASTLGISDRIFFAGQRNRTEALRLMAACDLLVLNSSYEGFPHVVLEAMSVGLPIVATAVGGTPELVQDGENGRLIPAEDERALSEALLRIVSSPSERQRLAERAKRAVECLSSRRMAEKTEALLRGTANLQEQR